MFILSLLLATFIAVAASCDSIECSTQVQDLSGIEHDANLGLLQIGVAKDQANLTMISPAVHGDPHAFFQLSASRHELWRRAIRLMGKETTLEGMRRVAKETGTEVPPSGMAKAMHAAHQMNKGLTGPSANGKTPSQLEEDETEKDPKALKADGEVDDEFDDSVSEEAQEAADDEELQAKEEGSKCDKCLAQGMDYCMAENTCVERAKVGLCQSAQDHVTGSRKYASKNLGTRIKCPLNVRGAAPNEYPDYQDLCEECAENAVAADACNTYPNSPTFSFLSAFFKPCGSCRVQMAARCLQFQQVKCTWEPGGVCAASKVFFSSLNDANQQHCWNFCRKEAEPGDCCQWNALGSGRRTKEAKCMLFKGSKGPIEHVNSPGKEYQYCNILGKGGALMPEETPSEDDLPA